MSTDPRRLARPRLHPDISAPDRVRVMELVLRRQTALAFELAAELERDRATPVRAVVPLKLPVELVRTERPDRARGRRAA